jgi:DNA-binding NtrC family response regulator
MHAHGAHLVFGNFRDWILSRDRDAIDALGAQILAEDETITIDDLPENMIVHPVLAVQPHAGEEGSLRLDAMERNHVVKVLDQFKNNKVHAARALGISRRSLYRLIEKYQLEPVKPENQPDA